jgi:hypothetical protein
VLDLLDIIYLFMIKYLYTLGLGECYDALFYLQSIYWLYNDEMTLLSALLSSIITYLCPS